jgi:hypothetical protein
VASDNEEEDPCTTYVKLVLVHALQFIYPNIIVHAFICQRTFAFIYPNIIVHAFTQTYVKEHLLLFVIQRNLLVCYLLKFSLAGRVHAPVNYAWYCAFIWVHAHWVRG